MPVLFKSLENENPVIIPMKATIADAIATTNVGVNSFANAQPLLDKVVKPFFYDNKYMDLSHLNKIP